MTPKRALCSAVERVCQGIARELPLTEGNAPPEWIELMPAGEVAARDGRRWRHDEPAAVMDATRDRAGQTDLVVDYEHQTEHASSNGQPAPAAGWIRELQVRAGSLWGRVEWTARAATAIAAREYRYISPTFAYTPRTKRVTLLYRAALTNSPALDLPALAGGVQPPPSKEELMDLEKILQALGLPTDGSEEQALAAIATLRAAAPAQATEMVPKATFDLMAKRAETAEQKLADRDAENHQAKAEAAVDKAVENGVVAPANRDYFIASCSTPEGLEQFEKFAASAPQVVTTGPAAPSGSPPGASAAAGAQTPEQKSVDDQLGLEEE
ncbi:MAG: hypothetical protein OXC31_26615 [Spirochaetaceae bacterium]|nr:hypothetical protein [Spirochaetaceae bacterium]